MLELASMTSRSSRSESMTPTLLHQQHQVSAAAASIANSVATLALFIGCVVVGALCDRLGARRVLQAGSVALAICYLWLFSTIDSNPQMPVAAVRDHRLHDRHDRRDSVRDGPRVSGPQFASRVFRSLTTSRTQCLAD